MSDEERANWQRIKDVMEEKGTTDNFFYKRAVAIVQGKDDPLKKLEQLKRCSFYMSDRAGAKSKAKAYTKSKKKGAMDGMTVKGGHKLSVKEGAGLTKKGRESINRRTGSNLKAPAPNAKPGTKDGNRRKSFCARSRGWTGERGKAARKRWNC